MINDRTVLSLVRAALDGIPAEVPADFPLEEYLAFAKEQQIEAILILGLRKSGYPISKDVRNILLQGAMMSNRQIQAARTLYAAFEANQIDYMPLKGSLLKSMYPSEEMRSMGDIDVLVRVEQYEKIHALLQAEGYHEGVESDHEYIWEKHGVHIELHKRLIPSYNKDYYAYYGEGWQLAHPGSRPYCYTMRPEDMFIYLFTHFAKHYRDSGVGIRQALDLYVCRKAWPQMDREEIRDKMQLLQLDRFYENTMHMLDVWFGGAGHTEASALISARLFASGVFGNHDNSVTSTMLKQSYTAGSVKKAKALNWVKRIFLPYSRMCIQFPCLEKWPVLLPFLWVVRWFKILLFRRSSFRRYSYEDHTANTDSVRAYQEMLHKSGLDFNFR